VFGAGGGTTSYREVEETDVIFLWGANARDNHPIFFHHVLEALHRGAQMYVVDPRRTSSAQWADEWMGLNVGSDIALAHAMARVIIHAGLANLRFIKNATEGFEAYAKCVEKYTLKYAERETGVPADVIERAALAYARAPRAVICWTLGITEHHNAVDNVLALINLSLLTGHVGRYGSGVNPLRGQNNVQGGGDMGAIPNRLVGFQDWTKDPDVKARFEKAWKTTLKPEYGKNVTDMFHAMEHGTLHGLYAIGENPAQAEADQNRAQKLLKGLDHLVVQDIFLTKTAEMATVVLPASASWCESEGTVTNSERRVQRVRKALEPPHDARDDKWIISEIARRMGYDWGQPTAEQVWDELRALAPMVAGMSYKRLEDMGGIQWPCYDENHPGELFLHARLWKEPREGMAAPFSAVEHDPPLERPTREYPFLLTTGRRLDSYNTGVQSGGYTSPLRRGESLDISPEDAKKLRVMNGDAVRVSSRRGSVVAPIHIDTALRAGLVFMTLHFQDVVATNQLTVDYTDPKSGTAEFKACAVKVEPTPGGSPGFKKGGSLGFKKGGSRKKPTPGGSPGSRRTEGRRTPGSRPGSAQATTPRSR
jgi:formate dehydrogenase major subunit